MNRYLPEALFFVSAAAVLVVLRLDAFGATGGFLLLALLLYLGMYHGAIPAALIVSALALKFKHRSAAAVAPLLGSALVVATVFLIFSVEILRVLPKMQEFYWGGLGIVPIVAIGLFIAARIRNGAKKAVLVYAGGVLLLAVCFFVTPWASDLVLVLMKGPQLRAELIESRGLETFATYDYSYGFDGPTSLLVYDPTDRTTSRVLARFEERDHCGLRGFRVVDSYYVISYLVDSKCD